MTQHDKQGAGDRHLPKPGKRNARFEQEAADSRDHDKQAGKESGHEKPAKTPGGAPKTS